MKFCFSGELDHRIGDAYRPVRAHVQARLNARCGNHSYGTVIKEIFIAPMILGPEFVQGRPERRLWQRKQRSADYRTMIDFEKFRVADEAERVHLVVQNTIHAIRDLQRKVGNGLDAEALISDILEEFGLNPADVVD